MSADRTAWTSKITKNEDETKKNEALTQCTVYQLRDLAEKAASDGLEPAAIKFKFQTELKLNTVFWYVSMFPPVKQTRDRDRLELT